MTAIASISDLLHLARTTASFTTVLSKSSCSLEAISGTTPPNFECITCLLTTLDRILPSWQIDAAVSSHEVSMPRMINLILLQQQFLSFLEINLSTPKHPLVEKPLVHKTAFVGSTY